MFRIFHKCLSILLCLCIAFLLLPPGTALAASVVRDADASTVNQWKRYFSPAFGASSTLYAGGVWTDKSVFLDAASARQELGLSSALAMQDPEHFMTVLSAVASSKSIVGRYAVPTDTVFVLDMSGSMTAEKRLDNMVPALNSAIDRLMELNVENRVGVVLYYGLDTSNNGSTGHLDPSPSLSSHVMLPLSRYQPTDGKYLKLTFQEDGDSNNHGEYTLSVVAKGQPKNDFVVENNATYIQNDLLRAWDEVFEHADTTVGSDGDALQRGRSRMPILVLMSDGAPTSTTSDFTRITASNGGNNRVATSHNAMGFVTQLTASYVRTKIQAHYHNDGNGYQPLVYTLGLGLSAAEQGAKPAYVARMVMDPSSSPVPPVNTGSFRNEPSFDQLWSDYLALKNKSDKTMTLTFQKPGDYDNKLSSTGAVTYNPDAINRHYVNRYFDAQNVSDLDDAFSSIVDEIIIQSLYYPTDVDENQHHHDGYLTFTDRIGEYMEVKDVKGLMLGNTLYSGVSFVKALTESSLGTVQNPTGLGDDFIHSVRVRLGIDRDTAQKLVDDAWKDGQLSYDASTGDYSNYLTWFSDANGSFIQGWTGLKEDSTPTPIPSGAAFRIRSYGYLDDVSHLGLDSNLMYVSVQVRTEINADGTDGDSIVMLKIPASMIPLIKTDIEIHDLGTNSESYSYTHSETQPLRLLYEVGLKDGVNAYTAASLVDSDHPTDDEGHYIFHTNQYDMDEVTALQAAEQAGSEHDPHENTLSYFTPALENERYYYTTDTYLFTRDGSGYVPCTASADPSLYQETLYAPYAVYHFDGTALSGSATRENLYFPVSDTALAEAQLENSTGQWYLPIHTVRRYTSEAELGKAKGTAISPVSYAFLPVIHRHDSDYHSATVLGNNGYIKFKPMAVEVPVSVQKVLVQQGNVPHGLDGFTFQLLDSTGAVLQEAVSDVNGRAAFQPLVFDGRHAGSTFTYTLREAPGDDASMEYSEQTYTLAVTVSWSANDPDTLSVDAEWTDLEPGDALPTFTNTYTLYVPPAGDGTPLALLAALTLLSLSGALMLVQRRKKRMN